MSGNLISRFLVHSYLYYRLDDSIITDSEFDQLCRSILHNWDTIEHPHKFLITTEDLQAGTGYAAVHNPKFPLIAETVSWQIHINPRFRAEIIHHEMLLS